MRARDDTFWQHLPRQRVEHDLSGDEKAAFVAVERSGEEVSEMLEYISARLEVIQNVRLKYRCERADGGSVFHGPSWPRRTRLIVSAEWISAR